MLTISLENYLQIPKFLLS